MGRTQTNLLPLWLCCAMLGIALTGCGKADPLAEGRDFEVQGQWTPAIARYERVLAEDPQSVEALLGRGRSHRGRGDHEAALADFTAAMSIDPTNPEPYYLRSLVYESREEGNLAQADRERAHALDVNYLAAFAGSPREIRVLSSVLSDDDESAVEGHASTEPAPAKAEVDQGATEGMIVGGSGFVDDDAWSTLATPRSVLTRLSPESPAAPGSAASLSLSPWTMPDGFEPVWPTLTIPFDPYRSPIWMQPSPLDDSAQFDEQGTPATTAANRKNATPRATQPAAKPLGLTTSPFLTKPAPATTPVTAPGTQPTAIAPGSTQRPTTSPFPQPPIRSTGRKD